MFLSLVNDYKSKFSLWLYADFAFKAIFEGVVGTWNMQVPIGHKIKDFTFSKDLELINSNPHISDEDGRNR